MTDSTHTPAPTMPEGMVAVSKDEFFRLLAADRRDIMPRNEARDHTSWEAVHARTRWGWSTPGWANPGSPKAYAVIRSAKAGA